MSKRIVVLGVSTFSDFLLRFLHDTDHVETVAVDRDEERINLITDVVDRPVIGNVRNRDLLTELDVASADIIVVSLGDIEGSLVTVLYLLDLKAPRIVAKALNSEHEHLLRLLGVEAIVFPEREMAEQVAFRLVHTNVTDSMTLAGGERVIELAAPDKSVDVELDGARLSADFGVLLLLVIDGNGEPKAVPSGTHRIATGDRLVLFGSDDGLDAFRKSIC